MTTEQLPDGLQLAVEIIESTLAGPNARSRARAAIRAEHAQRLTLQHHASDQAQRIADLETKCATLKRLHDAATAERDELRARLDASKADAAAAWVRYENANRLQVSLQMERAELRAKYDELLVALHGIGAALCIPECERSPYSVTCGTLERVNRLAEIEAQEPVAQVEVSVPHLRSIVVRDIPVPAIPDGCGACGDACKSRQSCRLADESPQAVPDAAGDAAPEHNA